MNHHSTFSQLKSMAVFCHVIDCGTMRAAAAELKMTPSAVSQTLKQLEADLEINLIHRSTRKLELSEAGKAFYQHCKQMLNAAQDANDAVHRIKHTLAGEIRIAAPVGLAAGVLAAGLTPLLSQHDQLKVTVIANDEKIDLLANRIDIAIRVGQPEDSNFIFHPLGESAMSLYASDDYLEQRGIPSTLEQLSDHDLLLPSLSATRLKLKDQSGENYIHPVNTKMLSNNMNVLVGFACNGLGIALLPHLEANQFPKQLTPVLPELTGHKQTIYALTSHRDQPLKVRVLLRHLKTIFSCSDTV